MILVTSQPEGRQTLQTELPMEGHCFRIFFFVFFWFYVCFSGSVAFRLFGFWGFYVVFVAFVAFRFASSAFIVPLFSHPLHCQFRCGRWLFGFFAFLLFGFGFSHPDAFPVGFWPWLPASSASQVPLFCPPPPPFRLNCTPN